MTKMETRAFFDTLPAFEAFEQVTDLDHFRPLPGGWFLAATDVVGSSGAIEAGRYKAVNMAGAGAIAAVLNAIGGFHYPFVFGGDGAVIAIPQEAVEATRTALAAVQVWVAEELQLTLRAALVPVADIRARGLDVRVARFRAAPDVSFAMFAGGGANWAESQMKAGAFGVPPAPPGTRPDISGLSCRWNPIESRHGEILSIIALPGPQATASDFAKLVSSVIALTGGETRQGHPLPSEGPKSSFKAGNTSYEASARPAGLPRLKRKLTIILQVWLVAILDRLNRPLGRFDARLYRRDVAQNSDFRKFDDGLKMTVDLDTGRSRQIEDLLEGAARRGICRYGLHRQETAIMTCLVPTALQRDHMHFIDGGSGGYAQAAINLKAKPLPAT